MKNKQKKRTEEKPRFFFCSERFVDGPKGFFQSLELFRGAAANHFDNGPLEITGAMEHAADHGGDLLIFGSGGPHGLKAVAEPIFLNVEDAADVGNGAVTGLCIS